MKRFINDIKKFSNYLSYAAKSDLKSEVASSHLNWLWWVLDPLCFMLVYTFISVIVFDKSEPYFPIYVFIGLTTWTFFNKAVQGSIKVVRKHSSIVKKVYVPKFIFIIKTMMVQGFKMLISFGLAVIMMICYRVELSFQVLYVIPITLTLIVITFGISTIMLHIGVFVEDLSNVMTVVMRLLFYMSGIFYSIEKNVPEPYNQLMLKLNPMANIINDYRNVLLYQKAADVKGLLIWFVVGLLFTAWGVRLIYKNENNYAKVM